MLEKSFSFSSFILGTNLGRKFMKNFEFLRIYSNYGLTQINVNLCINV